VTDSWIASLSLSQLPQWSVDLLRNLDLRLVSVVREHERSPLLLGKARQRILQSLRFDGVHDRRIDCRRWSRPGRLQRARIVPAFTSKRCERFVACAHNQVPL
jgi:hypothetical protein